VIRKIARTVLSEPSKAQIRRLHGKSSEDFARFAIRKVRQSQRARSASKRFRSSHNVWGRLAEVPAVRYSVLSDPVAARSLLDSAKGQELIAGRSTTSETPTANQFLALLANQPERIAEFCEREDVRAALRSSGVTTRVGTDWVRVALSINDRRVVDLLADIAGEGVATLFENQNFARALVEHLSNPVNDYAKLRALLESINRFDSLALHEALPQTAAQQPRINGFGNLSAMHSTSYGLS
jgi:hypothetical protein